MGERVRDAGELAAYAARATGKREEFKGHEDSNQQSIRQYRITTSLPTKPPAEEDMVWARFEDDATHFMCIIDTGGQVTGISKMITDAHPESRRE